MEEDVDGRDKPDHDRKRRPALIWPARPRNCAKADQSLGVTMKTSREFHDAAAGPTRSAATLPVLTARNRRRPQLETEDHVYA
jgi:hypothetical protein